MSKLTSRVSCLVLGLLAACGPEPDLVVYVAHDQVHAEPLLRQFERETGLTVDVAYDTETNKTIGHVNRIRAEEDRVRCDVFWNNEVGHTVALANEGRLASYASPNASGIPATFRDPESRWFGFGARARVFIVNTNEVDPAEIQTMWDLVDPRWEGRVGMARPLTGTTLTHMAALFDVMGEAEALRYLEEIKSRNERGLLDLTSGNATLMRKVRDGALAFGWTDTDDFNVALQEGFPVALVTPDQGGIGTMLIPNTIMILKGAPHRANAERFVDWVLREEFEATLAESRSAQIPVRASVPRPEHVVDTGAIRVMDVDYEAVGSALPARQELLQEMFLD
ncbi:MAG: extracellular solute-binding protein [Planctomycetota bacterium]